MGGKCFVRVASFLIFAPVQPLVPRCVRLRNFWILEKTIYPVNGFLVEAFSDRNEFSLVRFCITQLLCEFRLVKIQCFCNGFGSGLYIGNRCGIGVECLNVDADRECAAVPVKDRPTKKLAPLYILAPTLRLFFKPLVLLDL